jgi:tetratricopeptide (TPR) repeat protein
LSHIPAAVLFSALYFFPTPAQAQDEVERARALIREQKAAEAVELLKPVTGPESKDSDAFLVLGSALRRLRRYSEALAACRRAEELAPGSIDAVVAQAELHARLRQFPAAEAKYRKLLETNPRAVDAHVGLAWVLSLNRKLDDALAAVRKALEIDPANVDARIRLGWIHLWRHERDEAHKVFEAVVRERAGDVEAGLGLAAVDAAQGRLAAAGNLLEALARLHPNNSDVLMALARNRAQRGMTDEAAETAARIAGMQADHVEALQLMGELAIRDGRFLEAEAHYRKALEAEPEDVASRTGVATALRRQGRREEAKHVYRGVLASDPDHANARIGLGWEFTWEGDYDAASREFERVIARDPHDTDALAGLARVRHLQGRWSESQELYDRALAADPWDESVLDGHRNIRRLRESRVRLGFVHAEEFERDQVNEIDTIRLVTDALSASWRKNLSAWTSIEVEGRTAFLREINRVSDNDNYNIRHVSLHVGARHQATDHWTLGAKLGAGRFDDAGSGGDWTFDSAETFVEGAAWAAGEWDGHAVALSWSRAPLVIKAFPSSELDVLSIGTTAVRYETPWMKDGITPAWHGNRVIAEMAWSAYSDDNWKAAFDATLQHTWVYDGGWRVGPLVRLRASLFDEDVAFYYAYDRQVRLTIGAIVEYEPPGAWSWSARYQATSTETDERVNPGSHLFDPTRPIDLTEKTVSVDGHAIDARAAWEPGESSRLGIEGAYSWDNDHYVTWALGLFVELGF